MPCLSAADIINGRIREERTGLVLTTLPPKRRTTKKRIWPYVLLGTVLIFVLAAAFLLLLEYLLRSTILRTNP